MPKVLLTRSVEENDLAASELAQSGFRSCFASMLSYSDLPYDFISIPKHIIITSKHAAKIAAERFAGYGDEKCEAWVIGSESANILQSNPCIKITGVAKDLKGLINAIAMVPEDEGADFFAETVYLSGNIITHDLPEYIKRDIIYEVTYADEIPDAAVEAIKNGQIGYITAFSKNSAKNLIRLLKLYKLLPYVRYSAVIGISQEVALLFEGICSKILYSELPNFSDMIKILVHEQKNTR